MSSSSPVITLENEALEMHAEKGLFWREKEILLLADLHLGKVNHFRRAGIPITAAPNDRNLERLIDILRKCRPRRVIFMGDLFHSDYNSEWEVFGQTLTYFPEITFELVVGNHDVMSEYQYLKHRLILHHAPIEEGPFVISHEPLEQEHLKYNLAGHVHPGVRLQGRGRQRLTLPCFYFGKRMGLLPAFGAFTGLYRMPVKTGDRIFVVTKEQVLDL
jgi:DNA ligase-associated metallophosphoesterase